VQVLALPPVLLRVLPQKNLREVVAEGVDDGAGVAPTRRRPTPAMIPPRAVEAAAVVVRILLRHPHPRPTRAAAVGVRPRWYPWRNNTRRTTITVRHHLDDLLHRLGNDHRLDSRKNQNVASGVVVCRPIRRINDENGDAVPLAVRRGGDPTAVVGDRTVDHALRRAVDHALRRSGDHDRTARGRVVRATEARENLARKDGKRR
jgi:hypothetical protein